MRLALLAALLLLGGTVASELANAPEDDLLPAPGAAPAVSAAARLNQAGARPDRAALVLARPLLSASRRPAVAEQAEAAPSGGGALPRVAGVILSPGHRSVIFAGSGTNKPLVAKEGSRVEGFLIQFIEPGHVTVQGPDGTHVLRPSFDPNTSAPAARQ